MTSYEWIRLLLEPFLPYLTAKVRLDVKTILANDCHSLDSHFQLLDVGGRKSPYTIGLPASITILDKPRKGAVAESLHLGLTANLLRQIRNNRSNVKNLILADMTVCPFQDSIFDIVLAVEVIEHVVDDEAFIAQCARVLKPGGAAYFTTPNGDYVKNVPPHYNPDHIRHYQKNEFEALLTKHFSGVQITYGVKTGKNRIRGLKKSPFLLSLYGNLRSRFESQGLENTSKRTAHLFAKCCKRIDGVQEK